MSVANVDEESRAQVLTVMTEAELASMWAEEGDAVVVHDGRHWRATHPGFYQPTHLLARMKGGEITRPTLLCWGYRAALTEEDAYQASGSIPLYLLTEIGTFTEGALSRNRRSDLRRCRRNVEFRRLRDPSLLMEQGHRVFMSAVRRLGYWRPLNEADYRRRVERRSQHGRRLIVAGLIDGRLGGYLDSYAVNGVLYPEEIIVATDALRTGIGTGLYVETIEIGREAGAVRDICNGLDTPEDPELCHFKESLGFRVVHVPARTVIPAPILAYIKARRPATHYRLTGVKLGSRASTDGYPR
jgi:hypothetical protein